MSAMKNTFPRRASVLLGSVVLAATALAGPIVGSAPAKQTTVTVAASNQAGSLPYYLGKQKGFYRKAGIDLKLINTIPPAQLVAGLLANRFQFASYSWGATLSVVANGVPISGVATLTTAAKTGSKDESELDVLAGSNIKSPKDLAGKTIAVSALNGLAEIEVRYVAARAGVSQSSLKFVGLPFADAGPALRAGRIDVAYIQEPYVTDLKSHTKIRRIAYGHSDFIKGAPITNVMASNSYIKSNGKLVAAFRKATIQSVKYSQKHPAEIRKIAPGVLGLDRKITQKMILPPFNPSMDKGSIQRMSNAFTRFAKIKRKVSANEFVKP